MTKLQIQIAGQEGAITSAVTDIWWCHLLRNDDTNNIIITHHSNLKVIGGYLKNTHTHTHCLVKGYFKMI